MPKGTIYLLHFDRPYKHARHYLGWTENLEQRLELHKNGTSGVRLMKIIFDEGIGFVLARTWKNKTKKFERELKNRRCTPRYCPVCVSNNKTER